jgi:single-strand DNA-binding protein
VRLAGAVTGRKKEQPPAKGNQEEIEALRRQLAELAAKCLHKGARVGVTASLDQQKWTGEDGTHRSSFRLIANNLEFIKTDGRGFKEGQAEEDDIPF